MIDIFSKVIRIRNRGRSIELIFFSLILSPAVPRTFVLCSNDGIDFLTLKLGRISISMMMMIFCSIQKTNRLCGRQSSHLIDDDRERLRRGCQSLLSC